MKHVNKLFIFIVFLFLVIAIFLPISSASKNPESIFSRVLRIANNNQNTEKTASIILGGDVMLGRTVMTTSLDKNDPTYPFLKIADYTNSADLVFVNLENPIIENCPRDYESLKFCARPEMIKGLTHAGIDIVSLANNHSKNYGQSGFEETKGLLNRKGIDYVGDGNLVIRDVNGIKFGFLGFDFLTNTPQDSDYDLTHQSSQKVDILIVGVHWGVEYEASPLESQKQVANKLVESGASAIAGHHPHWVQSIDRIGGVPVYYSLGNLVFDQMWSEKTKSGLIVKLTFTGRELTSEEQIHTYMNNWAQPEMVTQ
ncbi:CapA family protein [Candidatus Microgenomates bacterium]|nr:MAG: CapA family protein [Candidatus Microgenomates bacterium]